MTHNIIKGFTSTKVEKGAAKRFCDVCGSKVDLCWFGNTAKICCADTACYSKLLGEYNSQTFSEDDC